MKRIITICICAIMTTALLAGCAPKSEAATPSPTPAVSEAATPEATPEPTPTPEPQPTYVSAYTVVLGHAPEDFAIDERYETVKFKAKDFTPDSEEITLKEVQSASDPGFVLYWFEDADGNVQYRAYGEKYEVLTRTDVDGTVMEFVATEPIESGLYPVTITRTEDGLTFTVDPAATPVNAEKWPVEESAAPTKDAGKPTPTPKSGSGNGGGNSGSNPTPAPTSGGGGGTNPTPAPAPTSNAGDPPPGTPTLDPGGDLGDFGGGIPIGGW